MSARVLFVEPFYGGSHQAFLDGLVAHSRHRFELLTLPEGEWRRRMRRGAQELALPARALEGDFDLLIASDMLDLPAFLALTRPRFERVPILAYFHENQFTYPRLRGTKFNSWFGQVNYLSALSANTVAFNSEFHRRDFLGALTALLGQPNNWLLDSAVAEIERKSGVLPVGVELSWLNHHTRRPQSAVRTIIWNHRWEFDKSPELFARAIDTLDRRQIPFRLIIVGEPGDNPSPAITSLPERFPGRVDHFGFAPSRAEYGDLLARADIVVSTTRHEFFGVGMVEAMAAGCIACAPNRYNYPALIPPELHTQLLWDTEDALLTTLTSLLTGPLPDRSLLQASASRFDWANVAPIWDAAIEEAAARKSVTNPGLIQP